MPRRVLLACAFLIALPGLAWAQAQTRTQTLEDIRQNLAEIDATVQALRAELTDRGARVTPNPGEALARIDALEQVLRLLTGRVEQAENDVRRMAEDAGRRYQDVEFRLNELEGGAAALPAKPIPLGGGLSGSDTLAGVDRPAGPEPVASEQIAFDSAEALRAEERHDEAALAYQNFLADYPDSALANAATFGLAESRFASQLYREAAKGYLAAYNADPSGATAAAALYGVGASLEKLGQFPEACLTFAEVERRFPDADPGLIEKVAAGMNDAGCK